MRYRKLLKLARVLFAFHGETGTPFAMQLLFCSLQNICINSTSVSYTVTLLFNKYQVQDE